MKILMKKIALFFLLFVNCWVNAANPKDSVVMTIAGKEVSLDEFLFMARKNKEVDLSDKKSVKKYVDLYKNFKLKVVEAESLGLDTVKSFAKELEGYHKQLEDSYLSDKEGREAVARAIYDRSAEALDLEHIVFRLPKHSLTKDTVAVYKRALDVYHQLTSGKADFVNLGMQFRMLSRGQIVYERVHSVVPMRTLKAFEDVAYQLKPGEISKPVRSAVGYHLIRVKQRKPNTSVIKAAHILVADTAKNIKSLLEEIQTKARSGEDFGKLAKAYSIDQMSAANGGELPPFSKGQMIPEFEDAVFNMQQPGDISKPVKSRFGYHIIKLIEKQERPSFVSKQQELENKIAHSEWNFDYNRTFDEYLKKEYDYKLHTDAYAELQSLCNDYFPTDTAFKVQNMNKPLFELRGRTVSQAEFVDYMQHCPFSAKTYAGDFMEDILNLYARSLMTGMEKQNIRQKHPEFNLLMNEYRDGILLFNISSEKIWNQPVEKQEELEKVWLKDLNKKYPVKINWRVIKKIKE